MNRLIVDASVVAKWYLPPEREQLHAPALALLSNIGTGAFQVLAPDLLWIEIGNIFWKATRQQRWALEDAERALSQVLEMDIVSVASRPLLPRALTIASACRCSVYDGIYVAVAAETDAPLITADERLARAVGGEYPVRWLGSL